MATGKTKAKSKVEPKKAEKPAVKKIVKPKVTAAPAEPKPIETTASGAFADPAFFLSRELSWLEFNERVLEEAQDKTNLILERLKFLAITASNLDEFFMVRVSNLMDMVESEVALRDAAGLTPEQQLAEISDRVHRMVYKQYNCLNRSIAPQLEKENIFFREFRDLSKEQKDFIRTYFESTLYPVLTPMAIDQSRPFPLLANRSLNVIVELDASDSELFAVVQVPGVMPRFLKLPYSADGAHEYIFVESIIKEFVSTLFTGHSVASSYCFRITRNSDLDIDEEETEDLLNEIERSIKRRKWGDPVRLEVEKNMTRSLREFLEIALELDERNIYEILGPLDLTTFMGFSLQKGFDGLRNEPLIPQPVPEFIDRDMFEVIRERDVLVMHPYESFDCVVKFVQSAAADPQVLAIKQTLYRVSGNSPIVHALMQAAENGKQVTVLVELKARFDEENNIIWAKRLEKSGCHVIYGLVGLKTHCKCCLVVRKEDDGIRRYVHLGTGNYNDSTAKIYTDHGLFTSKESFGQDISTLFNVLTGYSINLTWNHIAVAPVSLREMFLRCIDNETQSAKLGIPAAITAKMNSLVDTGIIQALYKASAAGVQIKLLVRGVCCLRPGIPGVSENITVVSIVDRFLEHSRIFRFENGGNEVIYLSSADWMPRNLDRRVEVAFPVTEPALRAELNGLLTLSFADTMKLRILQPDGTYDRVDRRGRESVHSQLVLHRMAVEAAEAAREIPAEERFRPVYHELKENE